MILNCTSFSGMVLPTVVMSPPRMLIPKGMAQDGDRFRARLIVARTNVRPL